MGNYDLLIQNGRVLDADTDFDQISDLAISNGRIERIDPAINPALADDLIDATGQWVIPGMIDTHVHVSNAAGLGRIRGLGLQMVAASGATTVIDLGGSMDALRAGIVARGSGVNVGSLGYLKPGETVPEGRLSADSILEIVGEALDVGSLGIKLWGGYYPFTPEETSRFIAAANQLVGYVAYHVGTTETGSRLDGLREVPSLLGRTGKVHLAHINAYCRGSILPVEEEILEALQIVESLRQQVVSEVHLARPNFTLGKCDENGNVLADVVGNCLRLRNYDPTDNGIRAALRDGYASTVEETSTGLVLVSGERGVELFDAGNTDLPMSFPVNSAESAFQLTAAKDSEGEFIIDAVGSDAGALPRNVNIEQSMRLVIFGALEPLELVQKLSLNPAKMIGLESKGRLTEGLDADITIIDPDLGKASYGFVGGELIMIRGRVVGRGGTILTTPRGERAMEATGLPFETIDITKAMMYSGRG
ncbi:MAG: amidohydrolase family protein [Dehalococcoidia bacterium]|nr:amidohydrolase family protein [Dehalococcoidia bacterium]MDP7485327.1 amidohydrolase family protein [Dehalococcoidia bacterium]